MGYCVDRVVGIASNDQFPVNMNFCQIGRNRDPTIIWTERGRPNILTIQGVFIDFNSLSPGPFPNPSKAPSEMVERLCQKSPMRRMGQPHKLKGALLLLARDVGNYITGQNILVDGGWSAW